MWQAVDVRGMARSGPAYPFALDDAIEQGRLFCNMLRANAAVV
jgi:hypothetical protein